MKANLAQNKGPPTGLKDNCHVLLIPGVREKLSKIENLGHLWLMFYKMHGIYEIKVSTHTVK